MKRNTFILASALLISVSSFAQKDQIKAAEKALKGGNPAEAANILKQAEGTIAGASDSEKAQYYYVQGNAFSGLADKKIEAGKNLVAAAKSYQQLFDVEKASGKSKYSKDVKALIEKIKNDLVNSAVDAGTKKDYKQAAELLYQVYLLDPTDSEKLYYAASYAVNGAEYDKALSYYDELKKQNYSGEGTGYYATNLVNDQEEFFGTTIESKKDRDNKVKLKMYTTSRDEKIASKRGEIYKNIALILVQQGKTEAAKASLTEARAANPDDIDLANTEANLYLSLNDNERYKKIISEVIAKNPNDPDMFYNLGVISGKTDPVEAEKYYRSAIKLKPDYANAYLNIAIMKLDAEKKLIDEMNSLGTSDKDNKRYAILKKQREDVFKAAIPDLEKAYELSPKNEDVATTLLNVYGALEMTEKKNALKAKLKK